MPERSRWSPEQGWLSLALLILLALVVGWAIDDAKWVPGPESYTDFLPWAAIGGVLAGSIGGMLHLGRLRAAIAGAVAAAIVVPVLVGSVIDPEQGDFYQLFVLTADAAVGATYDLLVLGRGTTTQFGHFLLVLGLLMWATGQFAGYSVFGHSRGMPAVVALGTVLLVNVILTPKSQLALLALFTLGALLLLVRMHAFEERNEWLRRRIGDPSPLAALTLRGGTIFVALAVFASLALTAAASSKPLESVWADVGLREQVIAVGRQLQRWFPFLNSPKGPSGLDFGPSVTVSYNWTSSDEIAAVISRPTDDETAYYWKAVAYDIFDGDSWRSTDQFVEGRDANQLLIEPQLSDVHRRSVTVTVLPTDVYDDDVVLSPGTPIAVNAQSNVIIDPDRGFLMSVEGPGRSPYEVTGGYPITDETDPDAFTGNKLAAAGTVYSDLTTEQLIRYTYVPDGAVGTEASAVLDAILQSSVSPAPYHVAQAAVRFFHSDEFRYQPSVTDACQPGESTAECFSRLRYGFCQWYATTMAVLLRSEGIPTRFVQGFLPGDVAAGRETITLARSHAWVEVWFPGFGWYPFDPTGGDLAQLAPLAAGAPVPSVSPRPSGDDTGILDPSPRLASIPPGEGTVVPASSGPGTGAFIAIGIALAAAVGLLALVAYRRGPREVTADSAWGSVTGMARRLGFGPRPTQTVYEYSDTLGQVLPSVRPELQTVARAKVEVAYANQILSADRIRSVKAATNRLRLGLLPLIFRRRERRRRR
jgi:hypothetical protein